MQKNGILSGAIMLSVGGVLAKIFSAVYRIALTRILGGVGIGLYQLVFPLYSLCVVIATAGLPLAISKVISKHKQAQNRVIKKCLMFTCVVSLILTVFLLIFSKILAHIQGEDSLYICYIILAPTIFIVAICSVMRGIYQGRRFFLPTALSNILEQFIKLVLGLIITLILVQKSVFAAIVGAMISIVISEIASLIVLLLFCKKQKVDNLSGQDVRFKEILRDILPITFTNILLPIASFVDSLLVVNLLKFNFTKSEAVFLYGLETGAVGSLVGLPTIFSFALASVILPSISGMAKNKNRNFNLSIKIVLTLTIPCVLLFLIMPKQLLLILYGKRFLLDSGGLDIAARLLQISSIGVLFLGVNQIFSSSLQAVEKRRITVKNLIIAVIIKFIVEVALMPTKLFNIYALSLSNSICYFVVMVLNFLEIKKQFKLNFDYKYPLIMANLVITIFAIILITITASIVNYILILILCVLIYIFTLFNYGIFNKKEIAYFKYKL